MSPFVVPLGSILETDEEGRASCMSLAFALQKMSSEEQLEHLAQHAKTCDDGPEIYDVCLVCVPLRREYARREMESS